MKIATIINFCTNDHVYLKHSVNGVRPFSSEIIVPVCDHFYDGSPENRELINAAIKENPGAQFVEFFFDHTKSSRWHCNAARKLGFILAETNPDYFLLLDTDEVIEPDKFVQWLKQQEASGDLCDAYKLANYSYFRNASHRAKAIEDSIVLVKNGPLTNNDDVIFHDEERGAFHTFANKKARGCTLDGVPFIHHYSWVRSKEAMLKKVATWSHNKDKDWASLVEKEFSESWRGTDVIFGGKEYETVEPYITL